MAANTSPIFPILISTDYVTIGTANTGRDGSGTLGTVVTGDADGTRVMRIVICATGTTTAGVIRLFESDGSTNKLFDEVLVSAVTPSTTVKVWQFEYKKTDGFPILYLKDNTYSLKASTHNAEGFNIFAICEHY